MYSSCSSVIQFVFCAYRASVSTTVMPGLCLFAWNQHCFNQWELCFSVLNQFGYISTPFWRWPFIEECQTKSFGMNLLLHAIVKFCTTKRLLKSMCLEYRAIHEKWGNFALEARSCQRRILGNLGHPWVSSGNIDGRGWPLTYHSYNCHLNSVAISFYDDGQI